MQKVFTQTADQVSVEWYQDKKERISILKGMNIKRGPYKYDSIRDIVIKGVKGRYVSLEDRDKIIVFVKWLESHYVNPERLLKAFDASGMRNVDLSIKTGLSKTQISNFAHGKFQSIGIESIMAISHALSISPQEGDLPQGKAEDNLAPPIRTIDAAAAPRVWEQCNTDPNVARVATEKAEVQHQWLVDFLILRINASGIVAKDSALIDVLCEHNSGLYLFEVKSISDNNENELDQIRAGFSQLKEYKFRYRQFEISGMCLALSRKPSLTWTIEFLQGEGLDFVWANGQVLEGVCAVPGLFDGQ